MTAPTITRRALANRAEIFSIQLRRLATDTEAAALHPTDPRALGILDADRAETIGAGERIDAMVGGEGLPQQLADIAAGRLEPRHLRLAATRWDAYAAEIDP